jgi:chromosome segregation ATPase
VTPDREAELQKEIAALRAEIATLRHDIADLRASAVLWKDLYEASIRRCEELDRELQKLTNNPN